MKHNNIAIFVPHAGCPYRCSFCDQRTITAQESLPHAADVQRICEQAFAQIGDLSETEIAFFGGSFTAIPRAYMTELLEAAKPFAASCKGIRISTRPDCIDGEILAVLREYHVTAIELGAQSLDDEVLRLNDRGHTAADVVMASALIRENGFELGLQIMPGLYGADVKSDWNTAEQVCKIAPDTVRIYPVVILKGTKLGDLYESGAYQPHPFDEMTAQTAAMMERFMDEGIRVIKVGLHASEFVAEQALGGYYHPAFRELCESLIYRKRMEKVIAQSEWAKNWTFAVHPSCISKAIAQKRANLQFFYDTYGSRIRIIGDAGVAPFQVTVREEV